MSGKKSAVKLAKQFVKWWETEKKYLQSGTKENFNAFIVSQALLESVDVLKFYAERQNMSTSEDDDGHLYDYDFDEGAKATKIIQKLRGDKRSG